MLKNALIFSAAILLMPTTASAMDIDIIRFNANSIITLDGEIRAGDAEAFKQFWEENAYDSFSFTIALNSPGGNLVEGMKLGRFFREQGVETTVQKYTPRAPMQSDWDYSFAAQPLARAGCYSACALAFMGGVERSVPEGADIGFHQFFGRSREASSDETMITTQVVAASISAYLREMGASPELFEIMSNTLPDEMFVPRRDELEPLGIQPIDAFKNFQLMPKDGEIVATSSNPQNPGALERVFEVETFCWKGRPMINLYAESTSRGLPRSVADPNTTHIDGWRIETVDGDFYFGPEHIRLYANQRLLATLILDAKTARALGVGSSSFAVNSYTASGVFMSGLIHAPAGDQAISASFKGCLD